MRDDITCDPDIGGTDHDCNGVGTPEGEWEQDPTCGLLAPGDNYNAGCISATTPPPFSPIACGQTICGTWAALVQGTTVLRDTDWYEIEFTQRTLMIVTMTGEHDISLGLISSCGTGDCGMVPEWPDYWTAGGYHSAACNDPAQSPGGYDANYHHLEVCVEPGIWWVFVSGDWSQAPVDCADYVLTLECETPCHVPCCTDNDVCVEVSETECVYTDDQCPGALGGALADAEDCAPGLCTWGCGEAVELTCNSETDADNSVNSDIANPPMSCATGDSVGVLWFKFVAETTSVGIEDCSSTDGDDSVFALYEGDCDNYLTELACTEDNDCESGSWLGRIGHCYPHLVVGEAYYIQFASWGVDSRGIYRLEIHCPDLYSPCGACCLPDNSCVDTCGPDECEDLGGWYAGNWTFCYTGVCEQYELGACCLADGSCLEATQLLCETAGDWIPGADCDPNPCPGAGACCTYAFGSYSCSNGVAAACTAANQTYYPGEDCTDPLFDCLHEACQPQSARSCRLHGPAGRLCLDLGVSDGIEPRLNGITEIELHMAGRAYDTNPVNVDCSVPWTGTATASDPSVGDNNTVTVTFDPALPNEACCVIALACGAEVCVCGLEGDIDHSGLVTTGDASIIKPHFGDTPTDATAEFDFDVSGLISTSDFSQVKPKFGNASPGCP